MKLIEEHKAVQQIAKNTISKLSNIIEAGISEEEIVFQAEEIMKHYGIAKYWYYNVGALVFVGERTLFSISGRNYKPTNSKVGKNDIVTIDLSPELKSIWGDYARTIIVGEGKEFIEGIEVENKLHNKFKEVVAPESTLETVYNEMNSFINELGYVNLDFNGNLGHSIESELTKRRYFESGNKLKLSQIDYFTFEPHVKKLNGKYGFKHEDIYYFDQNKLNVL